MPLRAIMRGRAGERPGLPLRHYDPRVVALLVAVGAALTGVGLLVVAFLLATRRS